MKVQFIADSSFIIEHNGCRILTDPWIGSTIYGGAWLQFPAPVISADDVGPLDYIFISHIHEDHCDPKTIDRLDRNAKIVILDRKPDFISNFLDKHGFRFKDVLKLPSFQKVEIAPGLAIEMIEADPAKPLAHLIDSSMVLHADDGKSLYFGNDTSPYPDLIKHFQSYDFSLALLAAAGGSGYPACFENLTIDESKSEQARIRETYFNKFGETVALLKPDNFMVVAGYHVIAGQNYGVNERMAFLSNPSQAYRTAYNHLPEEQRNSVVPVQLDPGEELDCSALPALSVEAAWDKAMEPGNWEELKAEFIENVASKTAYEHESQVIPPDTDWETLFSVAAGNVIEKVTDKKIEFASRLYINLPTEPKPLVGVIDGSGGTLSIESATVHREAPYLEISCDSRLLYQLLTGAFSWNIADAACFVRYYREPNVFDQPAFIALNYLRMTKSEHAEAGQ